MLNGDAHHSLVWEVEPRILPLPNCQRLCILNENVFPVKRKIKPQIFTNLAPRRLLDRDTPTPKPITPG